MGVLVNTLPSSISEHIKESTVESVFVKEEKKERVAGGGPN